jgi:hypothetical protein
LNGCRAATDDGSVPLGVHTGYLTMEYLPLADSAASLRKAVDSMRPSLG